jgi:hypothetical protein
MGKDLCLVLYRGEGVSEIAVRLWPLVDEVATGQMSSWRWDALMETMLIERTPIGYLDLLGAYDALARVPVHDAAVLNLVRRARDEASEGDDADTVVYFGVMRVAELAKKYLGDAWLWSIIVEFIDLAGRSAKSDGTSWLDQYDRVERAALAMSRSDMTVTNAGVPRA